MYVTMFRIGNNTKEALSRHLPGGKACARAVALEYVTRARLTNDVCALLKTAVPGDLMRNRSHLGIAVGHLTPKAFGVLHTHSPPPQQV